MNFIDFRNAYLSSLEVKILSPQNVRYGRGPRAEICPLAARMQKSSAFCRKSEKRPVAGIMAKIAVRSGTFAGTSS